MTPPLFAGKYGIGSTLAAELLCLFIYNPVYLFTAPEKEKIQFGAPGEATDCYFLRYNWWLWIPKRRGLSLFRVGTSVGAIPYGESFLFATDYCIELL